jgi:hypothetical protein
MTGWPIRLLGCPQVSRSSRPGDFLAQKPKLRCEANQPVRDYWPGLETARPGRPSGFNLRQTQPATPTTAITYSGIAPQSDKTNRAFANADRSRAPYAADPEYYDRHKCKGVHNRSSTEAAVSAALMRIALCLNSFQRRTDKHAQFLAHWLKYRLANSESCQPF